MKRPSSLQKKMIIINKSSEHGPNNVDKEIKCVALIKIANLTKLDATLPHDLHTQNLREFDMHSSSIVFSIMSSER